MNKFYSIIISMLTMFNATSCNERLANGCEQKHRMTDARMIPRQSFAYIELESFYNNAKCTDDCKLDSYNVYGSGTFIYRSKIDASVAFVLTVDHLCNETDDSKKVVYNSYTVYDYYGRGYDASYYFSSKHADICVLTVREVPNDLEMVSVGRTMPDVGSIVFNVSAPRAYYNPNAALLFMGLYSGPMDGKALVTIPTMPGSSGSPIFDDAGRLIGMISGIPLTRLDPTGENPIKARVMETLAIAESVDVINETLLSIQTIDDVFGLDLISTSTAS